MIFKASALDILKGLKTCPQRAAQAMQPLLARPAAQVSCGTWLLTWGNLVTNVVGAGFLALPQCVSSMSELTGNGSALSWTILLLAVLGTMNMMSFWLLARSCEYCKALQPNIDRIDYLSMRRRPCPCGACLRRT